jgi:hypothetical protein
VPDLIKASHVRRKIKQAERRETIAPDMRPLDLGSRPFDSKGTIYALVAVVVDKVSVSENPYLLIFIECGRKILLEILEDCFVGSRYGGTLRGIAYSTLLAVTSC